MVQVSTYPCFFYKIYSSFMALPLVSVQEGNRVDPIESGYDGSKRRWRHHQREEEIHCSDLILASLLKSARSLQHWSRRLLPFLFMWHHRMICNRKKFFAYFVATRTREVVNMKGHLAVVWSTPPFTASCMAIYSPHNNNNYYPYLEL